MYSGLDARAAEIYRAFDAAVARYTSDIAHLADDVRVARESVTRLETAQANAQRVANEDAAFLQELTDAGIGGARLRGQVTAQDIQDAQATSNAAAAAAAAARTELENARVTFARKTADAPALAVPLYDKGIVALTQREREMVAVDQLYAELMSTFAPSPMDTMTLSEILQTSFQAMYNVVAAVDGGAYGVTGPSISEGFLSVTRRTTLATDTYAQVSNEAAVRMGVVQDAQLSLVPTFPGESPLGPGVAFPEAPLREVQIRAETQFYNNVFKLVPGWRTAIAVRVALERARMAAATNITYGMVPTGTVHLVTFSAMIGGVTLPTTLGTQAAYLPKYSILYSSTVPGFLDVCYCIMRLAPAIRDERPGSTMRAERPYGALQGGATYGIVAFDPPVAEPTTAVFEFPYRGAVVQIVPRLQFLKRFYDINRQLERPFGLFVNEFYDQVLSAIAVGYSKADIKTKLQQLQAETIAVGTCNENIHFFTNVFLTAITDRTKGRRWPLGKEDVANGTLVDLQPHIDNQVPWKGVLHSWDIGGAGASPRIPEMPITLPLPYAPVTTRDNNSTNSDVFGYGPGTNLIGNIVLGAVEEEFSNLPLFSEGIFAYFEWTAKISRWVDDIYQQYEKRAGDILYQPQPITPIDVLGSRCIPGPDTTTRITPNAKVSLARERRSYSNSISICSSSNIWFFDAEPTYRFAYPEYVRDAIRFDLPTRRNAARARPFHEIADPGNTIEAAYKNTQSNSLFLFRGQEALHSVYELPVFAAPCALDVDIWRKNDENVFRVVEQPTIMSAMRTALAIVKACMRQPSDRPLRLWDICRAGRGNEPMETNDDVPVQFAGLVSKLIAITRAHTNGKQRNDWTAMQYLTSAVSDHKRNFTRLVFVPDDTTDGMHLELIQERVVAFSKRRRYDDDDYDYAYDPETYSAEYRRKIGSHQRPPVLAARAQPYYF